MLRKVLGGLSGFALMALACPANASLLMDTVDCDVQPSDFWSCDPTQAVVGGGVEFQLDFIGPTIDVDIGASSFSMTSLAAIGAVEGEELTISSLDWFGDPSGIILGIDNFFTDAMGMALSDITVDEHSVTIDFNNSTWDPGDVVSFDFVTSHEVPEPSTLALFTIGLVGLGFVMRRRKA